MKLITSVIASIIIPTDQNRNGIPFHFKNYHVFLKGFHSNLYVIYFFPNFNSSTHVRDHVYNFNFIETGFQISNISTEIFLFCVYYAVVDMIFDISRMIVPRIIVM